MVLLPKGLRAKVEDMGLVSGIERNQKGCVF